MTTAAPNDPIRLEVVVASVRAGRIAPVVADWFAATARQRTEFDVGVLDLAETPLPQDLSGGPAADAFTRRIGAADAFVVVTSEYNHGYPAALKTAIDTVKHEWRTKPVGFVSYGGLSGGLRAVEQLRQVVVEVHMVPVRQSVSFHRVKHAFAADGTTTDEAAIDGAERMLDQIAWWARTVRAGTALDRYPG
ncbi:NAD(P)H-dependent FMN reductase [Rhodococcus rhodochrous J3]|uniref:NAD(P)H-dependent oxidoreductase n=2 Tax=Rhodococcus rhodochrous TaxID=1829 RepID=A0AA47A8S7_RHORH|nr:NAD(P)H-dependent oxidoreductase [Rhodococcus rhodochrous]AYA27296.1 NADPH-dependent oxidoreductase [Rhodococcus rhodochrous]MBF4479589.1 NAD(P)H-dependent oxidoreductase [Rhodococcus rhodochrous]MCB8909467.1 NAD(P)H-dependent oxidoreductase [Rhodococcus rhodochrous]TWH41767.1 NAD(P)H-dependent FMN reductase [Rhodococcus rhodochrous J38]UZF43806.1 NAD(P)H-dependent oxidoreductase [Rhodococcus rhodochrous]